MTNMTDFLQKRTHNACISALKMGFLDTMKL